MKHQQQPRSSWILQNINFFLDNLDEGEGIIFLPKDLKQDQHKGVEPINYDDCDADDGDDDDDDFSADNDDDDTFPSSQRTPNRIGTRGGQ